MTIKNVSSASTASFKRMNYVFLSCFSFGLLLSCSDDSPSDEFEEANGDVAKKYITQLAIESTDSPEDDVTFQFNYDANGRLITVSNQDGEQTLEYQNGKLSNISGNDQDPFNIEELYQSPYDAFETGHVEEYDDNGNPYKIILHEEKYVSATDEYVVVETTAEIIYDNVHSPYYYTLESAGIIEVMDKVEFNFNMTPQNSDIVKAKALFPVNNPTKIVYKDENGVPSYQIDVTYEYDAEKYPITATVVSTSLEEDESEREVYTYTTHYSYKK